MLSLCRLQRLLFNKCRRAAGKPSICTRFHHGNTLSNHGNTPSNHGNSPSNKCKVAIIGSGPAGFYTTQQLIKNKQFNFHVDIFDKSPAPFGLVRYGVAPDHPEVKNCINTFEEVAATENVHFYGNVTIGRDVSVEQLLERYHIVLLAYGAGADKKLGIPGEGAPGCYTASEFVGWFNGVPEHSSLRPDLSAPLIIGHGNVALDCARILTAPLSHLHNTDISEHALTVLKHGAPRSVGVYGRRGLLQFRGSVKELRELSKLVRVRVESPDLLQVRSLVSDVPRPKKRLTELLLKLTSCSTGQADVSVLFGWSPVEITLSESGCVRGVTMRRNEISGDLLNNPTVSATPHLVHVPCSSIITSLGYNVIRLPGVPWCELTNRIPELHSRVMEESVHVRGLYTAGWARRGSDGVMATTLTDSINTANVILEDLCNGYRDIPDSDISTLLRDKNVKFVTYQDWQVIDKLEKEQGKSSGKPREKLVDYKTVLDSFKR